MLRSFPGLAWNVRCKIELMSDYSTGYSKHPKVFWNHPHSSRWGTAAQLVDNVTAAISPKRGVQLIWYEHVADNLGRWNFLPSVSDQFRYCNISMKRSKYQVNILGEDPFCFSVRSVIFKEMCFKLFLVSQQWLSTLSVVLYLSLVLGLFPFT